MAGNGLRQALGLHGRNHLVSIVGGGGKTSLMFALARALPGRVVLTTTTRIFAAQIKLAPAVCHAADLYPENRPQIGRATDRKKSVKSTQSAAVHFADRLNAYLTQFGSCLVVGEVQGEKALGVTPELPGQLLVRPDVDFVIVEADGSRMRPIKAPAEHEPVIPPETTLVVPVMGLDALDGPIGKVAHRPELALSVIGDRSGVVGERCSIVGGRAAAGEERVLTPQEAAVLLTHPRGGAKNTPPGARVIPFINKVETDEQLTAARQIAYHALRLTPHASRLTQVVLGAVQSNQPVREVHSRVTAVVLAAGQSSRMGQVKQLLPWGETTVLGQTIRHLKGTAVHDILVVSGYEADKIEMIALREGVHAIRNTQYAQGEMISSLQTAVRQLPEWVTAVLVILADQPMVPPEVIDQLLFAYWQGMGSLIAPEFDGRRGNPVLIGRDHFAELLTLTPDEAPRTLLQRHPADLHLVSVSSAAVLHDLDSPEDYERWRRALHKK
ncbi:MAG TPA: putative selenium-dependent hydroxylase accessory protein YqeC [Anaerolineae bacterium]|nr:putative selenium-dependent hydroxylase accessory protein YqeC [Anaerolineae bacterium]